MDLNTLLPLCYSSIFGVQPTNGALVQVISELVETCRNHDFTDIVIVHEHRGEPDGMVVCHLPYGPTAFFGVYNTVCALRCNSCSFRGKWLLIMSMQDNNRGNGCSSMSLV